MRAVLLVIAAVALTAAAPPKKAEAALLLGQTLQYAFESPAGTESFTPITFVVDGSVELPGMGFAPALDINIDVLDTQIVFTWVTAFGFTPSSNIFRGVRFTDINNTLPDLSIGSVVYSPTIGIAGTTSLTPAGDGNNLYFNLDGISGSTSSTITLNIVAATPPGSGAVPEPASLLIFGLGSVGMVVGARRRRLRVTEATA